MDAVSLDHLLGELRPILVGRRLVRPQIVAPHAFAFEVSSDPRRRLWIDVGRGTAGLYLLSREEVAALTQKDPPPHPVKQTLLLLRKHFPGQAVSRLSQVAAERTVLLEAGLLLLALRFSALPSLTLVRDGVALATVGGAPSWPLKGAEKDPSTLADRSGPGGVRVSEPEAAREKRTRSNSPWLLTPRPIEDCHDADLAGVSVVPMAIGEGVFTKAPSWIDAAAHLLRLRSRGARFEAWRRRALDAVRPKIRRLSVLEGHLKEDLEGLLDPAQLRREAEALLAFPKSVGEGESEARVPDPYDEARWLSVSVDPARGAVGTAERLFQKARRLERARRHLEERLALTQRSRSKVQAEEHLLGKARDAGEATPPPTRSLKPPSHKGPLHYLTSSGLSILVGRGARENHRLTFALARPEDYWLHARDVPGAHVILRDNEGRARLGDLREAAEVAAFFSDAKGDKKADVHFTRRKHLRPGGQGRAILARSETLRVAPRDPEGRLRRR